MAKKKDYPHKKTPRALADIQKEYSELCLKAGQVQYQIKVNSDELDKINDRLLEINYEAAERNQLEAEQAKRAPKTEEAANG